MKLKNKLFLNFGVLFFITINIFGIILVQSSFNDSIKRTIDNSLVEYSVIYTNVKTGENLNNIFLNNKDIIKIKSDYYLNNINNPMIHFEFRDLESNLVYSTGEKNINYPESLFNLSNNKSNYMILKKDGYKLFLINNIIKINNHDYYFTYINDINQLYENRTDNFFTLFQLNIFMGILLLVAIYIITVDITNPIYLLISGMDEVIKGNYNKKLEYSSKIKELNAISTNFNLMNNEIQIKISDLKRQNDIKQRFIDNLTHEIRTPLTSIIGYSKLMLKKDIKDVSLMHRSFENINREGERILSLTSNLITLITLDKKSLNLKNESLLDILYEVKNTFELILIENNIDFIINGNDRIIFTDRELISILISNFVDNSIKAVNNRINKEITLIIEEKHLIIKDNGKGIKKEELERIFEPFYMVDKSRSKSINGFGLGLSICKEIIDILEIEFTIESIVDIGTTIKLKFKDEV